MEENKLSRDNTVSVILSFVLGVLIALGTTTYITEYHLFATVILGFAAGAGCSVLKTFNLQNAQEGTSQSMKNKWKPVLLSFSFWIAPIVATVLALIIK